MPWRNGGGVTYELARNPSAASDEFDWRISIAEVSASGAFSAFPGVDRIITLIEGTDMVLTVDGVRHRLQPLEPFAFDGGADTAGEVPTPTRDLNVMTRRGRATAELDVIRLRDGTEVSVGPAEPLVLVALSGTVAVSSAAQDRVELGALDALCWTGPPLAMSGSAAVAVVRVRSAQR
jgi:environmental stress-induced protein Ves